MAAGLVKLLVAPVDRARALPALSMSEQDAPEAGRFLLLAEPHFGRDP